MTTMTFKEYCKISKYSLTTSKQYLLYEIKFRDLVRINNDELTQDIVNKFISMSNYSHSSIAFIKVFLSYLKEYELDSDEVDHFKISIPKRRGRKPSKKILFLTKEEVFKLINEMNDFQIQVITLVLFETGMRISEMMRLRWQYVDFNNNKIRIIHGKGNKERIVLISDFTKDILKQYMDSIYFKGLDSEIIFFDNLEKHMDRSLDPIDVYKNRTRYYDKKLKQYSFNILGKAITAHSLRHSCASYLRNDIGMALDDVGIYLGHSSLESTKIYSHRKEEDVLKKVSDVLNK